MAIALEGEKIPGVSLTSVKLTQSSSQTPKIRISSHISFLAASNNRDNFQAIAFFHLSGVPELAV